MEGNYFNGNIGAALQPNITYHATNNSATNGDRFLRTEPKRGGTFDLSYGYQTEDLRVEASLIYLQNKIKKSLMRATGFDIEGAPNMGSTKVIGLMANGMYDFNSESDFTPYIGFGIGGIRISQNIKGFPLFVSGKITTVNITNVVNDPAVTTTTSGNTTTTTTTYTQTTTVTTDATSTLLVATPGITVLPVSHYIQPSTVSPSPPSATPLSLPAPNPSLPSAPVTVKTYTNAASYADGNSLQFAYQTIIGMSYKIMDDIKLSADYRYLRALPTTFTVVDAGDKVPMKGSYSNHRFMLGMTMFF